MCVAIKKGNKIFDKKTFRHKLPIRPPNSINRRTHIIEYFFINTNIYISC